MDAGFFWSSKKLQGGKRWSPGDETKSQSSKFSLLSFSYESFIIFFGEGGGLVKRKKKYVRFFLPYLFRDFAKWLLLEKASAVKKSSPECFLSVFVQNVDHEPFSWGQPYFKQFPKGTIDHQDLYDADVSSS